MIYSCFVASKINMSQKACSQDSSPRAIPVCPDKGPWVVNEWSDNRVVLQSDDFEHDVALVVDGDFGSLQEKLAYAEFLAAWMNACLGVVPRHLQARNPNEPSRDE